MNAVAGHISNDGELYYERNRTRTNEAVTQLKCF